MEREVEKKTQKKTKERQASLKKLEQQGNSGTEASHGQSRHGYYEKERKKIKSQQLLQSH